MQEVSQAYESRKPPCEHQLYKLLHLCTCAVNAINLTFLWQDMWQHPGSFKKSHSMIQ